MARRRLLGWKVLFIAGLLDDRGTEQKMHEGALLDAARPG